MSLTSTKTTELCLFKQNYKEIVVVALEWKPLSYFSNKRKRLNVFRHLRQLRFPNCRRKTRKGKLPERA